MIRQFCSQWPHKPFKEVADIVTGTTPPKANPEYYGGDVPFITPVQLIDDGLIADPVTFLSDSGVKRSRLLPVDSILVTCIGTLGKIGIAERPLVTNQQINSLIFDSNVVHPKYAYFYCKTLKPFIEALAPSTTVPIINKSTFSEIEIPLPPLSEQKRIAGILDKADTIRRNRKAVIKRADDFLHATFLDMFGDPVSNPNGWKVKKLKELSTNILNGTTPKGGKKVYVQEGILFFRSQNVWRNRIVLDDVAFIDNETHLRMKKSSLKNKDLLITKTGRINTENSSLGRAAMFLGQNDSANINGHVYLIRLHKDIIHEYVLYILTTDEYREYIRRVCVGGIDKRQINKEHLEKFPIIFPPIDLQHRFASIIKSVELQKSRLRRQQAEIDTLFASLTQRAFRGEL